MVQSKPTDAAGTLETGYLDTFVYVKTLAVSVDYRPVSDTSTRKHAQARTATGQAFALARYWIIVRHLVVESSPGL